MFLSKYFLIRHLIFFCLPLFALHAKTYPLTNEPIDVVIPCREKDKEVLDLCIEGIKRAADVRRIIVISSKRLSDKAEWFDEKEFPFSKSLVSIALNHGNYFKAKEYQKSPLTKVGWYYQQLLKLYSPLVIPGISSNVLLLDADTIFLNPVVFLNNKNGSLFNDSAHEYNDLYFAHMERLLPGLTRQIPTVSGISHHMLIQKPIVLDLITQVEELHEAPFWEVFCRAVKPSHIYESGASEYEIYFNFALKNTSQVSLRTLKFANVNSLSTMSKMRRQGYHFISYHWYLR